MEIREGEGVAGQPRSESLFVNCLINDDYLGFVDSDEVEPVTKEE